MIDVETELKEQTILFLFISNNRNEKSKGIH